MYLTQTQCLLVLVRKAQHQPCLDRQDRSQLPRLSLADIAPYLPFSSSVINQYMHSGPVPVSTQHASSPNRRACPAGDRAIHGSRPPRCMVRQRSFGRRPRVWSTTPPPVGQSALTYCIREQDFHRHPTSLARRASRHCQRRGYEATASDHGH